MGGSILYSSPVCQLCRQLWAFATVSASCQHHNWPVREKLRPKPSVTQPPMTASDGRAGEEGDGEGEGGEGGSGALSSMTAVKTATAVMGEVQRKI